MYNYAWMHCTGIALQSLATQLPLRSRLFRAVHKLLLFWPQVMGQMLECLAQALFVRGCTCAKRGIDTPL